MAGSSIKAAKKLLRFAFALTFLGGSVLAMLFTGCNRPGGAERMADRPIITGPIVYVALGDSTGAGVGAREGGYVKRLFNRITERRPESKLSNLCVSGATTADLVRGQLEQGVALNPDLVTVGIGINDIGHGLTLEQFSENFEEILGTLKEKTHAQIVVTNLPDVSSAPRIPSVMRGEYQRQIDLFCQRLVEIANRHGVTVFDIYTVTKDELPAHPEYFSADGFHPSDEGYELWATQMWPTVARVIGAEE
jgi:lysophospholipase L1-like esterase